MSRWSRYVWYIKALPALGVLNLLRVTWYRILKKGGVLRWRSPVQRPLQGPFVSDAWLASVKTPVTLFSAHVIEVDSAPDWFRNYLSGARIEAVRRHWTQIADFDPQVGDIKPIWELSRFDWAPKLAWQATRGNVASEGVLEGWLRDWVARNPPNEGPNWKCGQETALRAINLLLAHWILKGFGSDLSRSLECLLEQHCRRVSLTTGYAVGQQNNHAISEAVALFVIGSSLAKRNGARGALARKWARDGRRLLSRSVSALFLTDGSFAQHSITYHRMAVDLVCLAELYRRSMALRGFGLAFEERMRRAVEWLATFVCPVSGDAPNLGSNDGAYLFNIDERGYRDFRPSLAIGHAAFGGASTLDRRWAEASPLLAILKVPVLERPDVGQSAAKRFAPVFSFDDGGFLVRRDTRVLELLRLPSTHFRMTQEDVLHFDLWVDGVNLIRDSGTFSYNARVLGQSAMELFAGVTAHSTVQFDGRGQSRRLGRFLLSPWPSRLEVEVDSVDALCGSVRDFEGATHTRRVRREGFQWTVTDELGGAGRTAKIRWRLPEGHYDVDGESIVGPAVALAIASSTPPIISVSQGLESDTYMRSGNCTVVEIDVWVPSSVTTTIRAAEADAQSVSV